MPSTLLSIISLLLLARPLSSARPCNDEYKKFLDNLNIPNCRRQSLGVEFGWKYNSSSRQLDIALASHMRSDTGWIAWGLNPIGRQMVGTRALIGVKLRNGTLVEHLYNITGYTKSGCQLLPSDDAVSHELGVRKFGFHYLEESDFYVIRATIILPEQYNAWRTNVVWQTGSATSEAEPRMHMLALKNFHSAQTVSFMNEGLVVSGPTNRRPLLITIHGLLNMVGWGTLIPCGVLVGRYLKTFPFQVKHWKAIHAVCSIGGYMLGTAGWAIGLWVGRRTPNYTFHTHWVLGIFIFVFTSVEAFALVLRPKGNIENKTGKQSEYHMYWNMYHHFLGYSILALIWTNLFIGVMIVQPNYAWKWVFWGDLGGSLAIALCLEAYTWIKFYKMVRPKPTVANVGY